MPKFVLRIAGRDFVVPDNRGVATLIAMLADAVPVDADLHGTEPTITLEYDDRPEIAEYLAEVRCVRIPRNVTWKRKAKSGEVQTVRPVEKEKKKLRATAADPRLLARGEQLALVWNE